MYQTLRFVFTAGLCTAVASAAGCGSSSSGGGASASGSGLYCNVSSTASPVCYGYSNLTPNQQSAVTQTCSQALGGMVVSSCPATGQVGCCTTPVTGYTQTECYYSGSLATWESICNAAKGTWSGGMLSADGGTSDASTSSGSGGASSGGSGGSSGGSGSGSGGGSGACTACPSGCVNLQSDPDNCGSCEYACPMGPQGTMPACSGAKCQTTCLDVGQTFCARSGQGGQCVDTQTDGSNCGGCGITCKDKPGSVCLGGQCTCAAGTMLCGSSCVNPSTDKENCGGCAGAGGVACASAQSCSGGACSCPSTEPTFCSAGSTCVDLQTDSNNCGQCGNECPSSGSCVSGACQCPAGWTSCDVTSSPPGFCTDTSNDYYNCGGCGFQCMPGQLCGNGGCCNAGLCP